MAMQLGRPAPHLNRHVRTNRLSFGIACAFIMIVAMSFFDLLEYREVDLLILLVATSVSFFAGLIVAPVVDDIMPIRMYESVLRTYTGFGTMVDVEWDKIRRVSTLTIAPGFSYLVLDDRRTYLLRGLIPLYISNQSEFYEDLVNVVGEDHIVANALRAKGFGS